VATAAGGVGVARFDTDPARGYGQIGLGVRGSDGPNSRDGVMTASEAGQLYLQRALEQMPRSISLQDREPLSRTYGCFDRTYWAWKFVDFAGARYQEGVYPLSFVFAVDDGGQGYLGNARALEWIEAGMAYWASIQHRDGSFDEAYPHEHSLAATAFTSFYIAEALRLVDQTISATTRDRTRDALIRAGEWLVHNDETHGVLSNHLAAAAAALIHVGQMFDDRRFVDRSRHFLDRILAHQSTEGWYEEYAGADPGYQTHATFYLARYWQLTGDETLAVSLDRSVEFIKHFVHPDGTLGGEYGSRSTQFVYPAGFEILAARNESARWIAAQMAESIRLRRVASLETMDAQNFYPLLNNVLFAGQAAAGRTDASDQVDSVSTESATIEFPDAGLVKVVRPGYELVVGTSKGGVFKLFDRSQRRLVSSDCGFVGRLRNGQLVASQVLDRSRRAEISDDRITVEAPFYAVKRTVFRPLTFMLFRLVNVTLGRVPAVARWVKSLLVKVLITRRRATPLTLRRTIVLGRDGIEVRDHLQAGQRLPLERLGRQDVFSTIHMGSSRYFQTNELNLAGPDAPTTELDRVALERLTEGVDLRRSIAIDNADRQ